MDRGGFRHFSEVKKNYKVQTTSVLALPDFTKIFKVECDASICGVGAVLSQNGHLVGFHTKNSPPAERNGPPMSRSYMCCQGLQSMRTVFNPERVCSSH